MNAIYEETYRGYVIKIMPDEDGESPRDWDNLGTMICGHRNYNLGDVQIGKAVKNREFFPDTDSVIEFIQSKNVIALPLYLLDHSGLWIRTGRFAEDPGGWDTSFVGYIYATKETLRKEYGKAGKKEIALALSVLEDEIETYNDYLTGNVFGYQIYKGDEEVESCWGFYPEHKPHTEDYDYCLKEAKSIVDYRAEGDAKEAEIVSVGVP